MVHRMPVVAGGEYDLDNVTTLELPESRNDPEASSSTLTAMRLDCFAWNARNGLAGTAACAGITQRGNFPP